MTCTGIIEVPVLVIQQKYEFLGFSLEEACTWYQWVSGWVGAVDSQTVELAPMKATSNQKASPCTVPEDHDRQEILQ